MVSSSRLVVGANSQCQFVRGTEFSAKIGSTTFSVTTNVPLDALVEVSDGETGAVEMISHAFAVCAAHEFVHVVQLFRKEIDNPGIEASVERQRAIFGQRP